jgi:diguanylate cyclase (GGDEF)-like protein/PAS domain S-box-containing protein
MDHVTAPTSAAHTLWAALTRPLPTGRSLPPEAWRRRHRIMLALLWAHAAGLGLFGYGIDAAPLVTAAGSATIGAAALIGSLPSLPRGARMGAVSVGLMAAPALLVHLTEGLPQSHFHFFVMLAVIALYQDWFPFLTAVGAVLAHHAVLGSLYPGDVVSRPAALQDPMSLALLHAGYVLAAAAVSVVAWRLNETERSQAEQLLDATGDGIYGLDHHGCITFVNAATARLLQTTRASLLGRPDHEALGHAALDGTPLARAGCPICAAVRAASAVPATEACFTRADGTAFPVEYTSGPLRDRARVLGTAVTFTDLTEHAQLTERALHDSLTGLPNRGLLQERLQQALARLERRDTLVAVLFLDLDRFKVVNDSLGHAAGDELLIAAARRLQTVMRTQDTVARFGGDEFVLLCEDIATEADVVTIAERITAAFGEPFAIGEALVSASASIGITLTADHRTEAETLVRDADAAMYRAKERGRNGFELFDDEMRARAVERLAIESDLRVALDRGELVVHYQPKVDLRSGAVTGVEALVRWQHPTRGLIPPMDFIPIAEETGQIVAVGAWVLEEACREAARWRREQPGCERLLLSVNVSGRQLAHPGLVDLVADVLQRTRTHGSLLCLEITESVLMRDADGAAATLRELKRLGVMVAVDDFGTGYSSLSYLTRFPVDAVKVDRSFVGDLGDTVDSWSIVAAIIGLSQSLGLTTVAEGVERSDQAAVLRNLGCELAQGFHYARPQPAAEVEAFLSSRDAPRVERARAVTS